MLLKHLKRHLWPGNVRELKNVLERATILFENKKVEKKHVIENNKVESSSSKEEQEALWDATQELNSSLEEDNATKETFKSNAPLPHPKHYADWFDFFENIDLRLYLRDVEVVLIESALKKADG